MYNNDSNAAKQALKWKIKGSKGEIVRSI